MTLLQAIILGIVQGLTEFIPVSSTAHLVIAGRVMKLALTPEQLTASIAVVQLGTLIAVFIYFAGDIWNITSAFTIDHLRLITGKASPGTNAPARLSHDAWLGWLVIIGSIPVAAVGLLFRKQIEGAFTKNLWVIATMMIVVALLLTIAEFVGRQRRHMQDLGVKDALAVGFAQVLALIPGSSRSGSTIMAGLFAGETRETAALFVSTFHSGGGGQRAARIETGAAHPAARQPYNPGSRHDRFGYRGLCIDLVPAALSADAHDRRLHRLSFAGGRRDSRPAIQRPPRGVMSVQIGVS